MRLAALSMIGGAPSASPTILVVEDEVLVRAATTRYLRDCGFIVIEAVDADEALGVLRATAAIKLVFADVRLPGTRNGLDLLQIIRNEYPDVKALLTTGARPFPEGVPLVRKPYILFEVERQIRTLLRPAPPDDLSSD